MLTVAGSVAVLPAVSTAVPVTVWLAPSPVTVWGAVQLAMPDKLDWSSQLKVTVTSVLFQPLPLAAGSWVWPIVGGVLSILTWISLWASLLPALSTLQNARV